jgi:ATP-dependent Lon protease
MSESYAPGTVIERLALFPLSEVVFFPGTLLPLHVFEPRYRQMTEEVLAGSKQMCVVLVTDVRRVDERGHPPIASIAGVGEIIRHQKLADGRHNIVLAGRARVRLDEIPFDPPYRRARAEVIAPVETPVAESDITALVSIATRFATQVESAGHIDFTLPPTRDPGMIADACVNALVIDPSERQRVLETLDIGARVRLASELLAVQQALLARGSALH